MSVQIAVLAPATRVMSRKLGPTCRQRLALLGQPRGRLRDEHVGQHVRQVAEDGHEPVVGLGVDRDRAGAELHDEAVQALVEEAARLLVRREVPGRALEQVGARVLHAGGLGAGDRVAADEARVRHAAHEVPLRRAHVRDERVLARRVERRPHQRRAARRRARRRSTSCGALDGILDRGRGAVDRAALARELEPLGIAAEADHLGVRDVLLRGQADRAADQPDAEDGDLHTVAEVLAGQLRRGLDLAQVGRELLGAQRLRTVADRLLGTRVHLDDDPVGAGRGCRERQRQHQRAPPGRVARVDHDRAGA